MKKIISILILTLFLYNCNEDDAYIKTKWPQSVINKALENCIHDGNSELACNCAINRYQDTFTYSEIERLSSTTIEDFNDVNYNDAEKILESLIEIFQDCEIIPN